MINYATTPCKNCMVLIRMIVLKGLVENVRIFARHVKGEKNELADSLSRDKIAHFKKLCHKQGKDIEAEPTQISELMWPVEKIWKK